MFHSYAPLPEGTAIGVALLWMVHWRLFWSADPLYFSWLNSAVTSQRRHAFLGESSQPNFRDFNVDPCWSPTGCYYDFPIQWEFTWILKWRYCTINKAMFCRDIPKNIVQTSMVDTSNQSVPEMAIEILWEQSWECDGMWICWLPTGC